MKTIAKILSVRKKVFKDAVRVPNAKPKKGYYYITTTLLSDGLEATGFGKGYVVGEEATAFFDERYGTIKFYTGENPRQRNQQRNA